MSGLTVRSDAPEETRTGTGALGNERQKKGAELSSMSNPTICWKYHVIGIDPCRSRVQIAESLTPFLDIHRFMYTKRIERADV